MCSQKEEAQGLAVVTQQPDFGKRGTGVAQGGQNPGSISLCSYTKRAKLTVAVY